MTGDIRKQLGEALDEAQQVARAAVDPWNEGSTGVWKAQPDAVLNDLIVDEGSGEIVTYDEGRPTSEQSSHMARWDPSTVLRLIERDRQLLADVVMVEEQQREHSAKLVKAWKPRGDEASIPRLQEHAERIGGRLDALMAEVERAAAFWLGTPDLDR